MKAIQALTFPNVAWLRSTCIQKLASYPHQELTQTEWARLQQRIQLQMQSDMITYPEIRVAVEQEPDEAMDIYFQWATTIVGDLSPLQADRLPKWAVFLGWLSSDGMVLRKPSLVTDIIREHIQS